MKIRWYGHSCFVIEYKGFTIVTDPFDNCVDYTLPYVNPDIITVSHDHGDHSDPEFLKKAPNLDFNKRTFENEFLKIKSFESYHDETNGSERGKNLIFSFSFSSGLNLIHLGDQGCALPKELLETIPHNHVLLAPFGGVYTVDGNQSVEFAKELKSRVVVAMHYKTEKVGFDLKTLDDYNFNFIKQNIIEFNAIEELPEDLHIVTLDYEH